MQSIKTIFANEEGATAIEYGLIAALIAVAAVATIRVVGTRINNAFVTVQNALP